MTREEAAKTLAALWGVDYRYCLGTIGVEAVDMAIEALQEPERKKGKWNITDAYPHNIYCSECHIRYAQTHWPVWEDGSLPRNYCPNCGAEMEVKDDE